MNQTLTEVKTVSFIYNRAKQRRDSNEQLHMENEIRVRKQVRVESQRSKHQNHQSTKENPTKGKRSAKKGQKQKERSV